MLLITSVTWAMLVITAVTLNMLVIIVVTYDMLGITAVLQLLLQKQMVCLFWILEGEKLVCLEILSVAAQKSLYIKALMYRIKNSYGNYYKIYNKLFSRLNRLVVITYYRTPTGVIDHETCTDNFLYRPKHVNNSFSVCELFTLY